MPTISVISTKWSVTRAIAVGAKPGAPVDDGDKIAEVRIFSTRQLTGRPKLAPTLVTRLMRSKVLEAGLLSSLLID